MRFGPVRLLLIVVILIAILGVPAGLYGFNLMRSRGMADYFTHQTPPRMTVTVVKAVSETVPNDLRAIGSLQAVHQVSIAPEIGGRIVQLSFQSGASVQAGTPLVQLNDGPARGDLASYQSQLKLAQLSLQRSQTLVRRQFESQANVDQNQAQLEQAKAMIAKTEAQLAQLVIRAPFSGELGVRQVDLGQFVSAGQPIVTLTDLAHLYVNFSLPEKDRGRIADGQNVTITSDAFPGKVFQAKVTTLEPQISTDTRMISLQATLDNPDTLLLPGMYVDASLLLPEPETTITVPETAVDYSLYGDSVWIVDANSDSKGSTAYKVRRNFVHTGRRFAGKVAIKDGLKAGQTVVTAGQLRLNNGATVAIAATSGLAMPSSVPTE